MKTKTQKYEYYENRNKKIIALIDVQQTGFLVDIDEKPNFLVDNRHI